MDIFVGTSGWAYSWNKERNLKWYVENSKLNAIELNMSFYRFPFPNVIKGWAKIGKDIRWSIKVNKIITHLKKFEEDSFEDWKRFEEIFSSLKENIDFFLFQLPPSLSASSIKKIQEFAKKTKLKEKFAIEFRNKELFNKKYIEICKNNKMTLVSVDAPYLPREIYNTNGIVYLRMHGREAWYRYEYNEDELKEIVEKILKKKPKKVYVFFNNNHAMLKNAIEMKKMLESCV